MVMPTKSARFVLALVEGFGVYANWLPTRAASTMGLDLAKTATAVLGCAAEPASTAQPPWCDQPDLG